MGHTLIPDLFVLRWLQLTHQQRQSLHRFEVLLRSQSQLDDLLLLCKCSSDNDNYDNYDNNYYHSGPSWLDSCPKTKPCSTACADQASICHIASQHAVNSKVELKYALSQAGRSATADASTKMRLCSYAKGENPSVILPAADKAMQYVGTASTCAAVPSETASACAAAARLDAPHRLRGASSFLAHHPCFLPPAAVAYTPACSTAFLVDAHSVFEDLCRSVRPYYNSLSCLLLVGR